ncbi:hypothetical protein EMIT0111MI5_50439 [Burkholderia sp. IT-111MI5]
MRYFLTLDPRGLILCSCGSALCAALIPKGKTMKFLFHARPFEAYRNAVHPPDDEEPCRSQARAGIYR